MVFSSLCCCHSSKKSLFLYIPTSKSSESIVKFRQTDYIPFNKCLKEFSFPDCWKVSLMVPVFKDVRKRSRAKNYRPVSLLFVVSKLFEKLVNNRFVDHLEKCDFLF